MPNNCLDPLRGFMAVVEGFPKSLNVSKDRKFCQCDNDELRGVRQAVSDVPEDTAQGEVADVLAPVQREGTGPGVGQAWLQGVSGAQDVHRHVRGEEPGMEGRGDPEAPEGQLHGSAVRTVSTRVSGDGTQGWLHHGAPAGDGQVDRATADQNRSGESHRPQSREQREDEPGFVAYERGSQTGRSWPICGRCGKPVIHRGLGTALKPAWEPIILARKPIQGTVAANVLEHGTGALNIDACRIGNDTVKLNNYKSVGAQGAISYGHDGRDGHAGEQYETRESLGRWPANVVLDEEMAAELDQQTYALKQGGAIARGSKGAGPRDNEIYGTDTRERGEWRPYADSGGASRFFYCAKAPTKERPKVDGVAHPTVKPLELMRWLVKLVTPPRGRILDPFAGSGTTVEAAILEGFRPTAIELNDGTNGKPDYVAMIEKRAARAYRKVADGSAEK
jgi:DNA methylase